MPHLFPDAGNFIKVNCSALKHGCEAHYSQTLLQLTNSVGFLTNAKHFDFITGSCNLLRPAEMS